MVAIYNLDAKISHTGQQIDAFLQNCDEQIQNIE